MLLLAGLSLWLGWSGVQNDAFHNQDVAGITYNADVILNGGVPYHTNLEYKAPGSFFLTAIAWTLGGRSMQILQWAAALWTALGVMGVFVTGRLLYSRASGLAAGLLYAIYACIVGSMDANYGVWMATPCVWATAACVWALRSAKLRAWLVCGVLLAIAGLCKRQAAALFPVFMLVLLWRGLPRPSDWADPAHRGRATLAFFAGMALGFGGLGLWYLAQGGAEAYIRHYFFSESGWRYAAQSALDFEQKLLRLGDGVLGFWEYVGGPALLTLCVAGVAAYRRRLTVRGVLLTAHLLMSFAGAAVGFRFFKSYYQQVLPALCWIAAHPDGPILRGLMARSWRAQPAHAIWGLAALIGIAIPASIKAQKQYARIDKSRSHVLERDLHRVARNLKPNLKPDDTVWVWGRWAWPLYFHLDRRAPTRFYKVLGVVTTDLTNTWRRPTLPTTFVDNPEAKTIIADLRRTKPAFIVVSTNERYHKWKAFKRLLREEYRVLPHFKMRRFVTYYHKDQALPKPPRPHPKKRKPKGKLKGKSRGTPPRKSKGALKHGPTRAPKTIASPSASPQSAPMKSRQPASRAPVKAKP